MTASAAGKPNLSVANISDGQKISWSSTGAQKYYLYFGVYDYNTRKTEWRVYREVNGATFTINNKSLHSSGWKRYVNYKSTPYLTSGQAYCYQIHAGNVNTNGRPIDNRYSKVRSMTYLAVPFLNWAIDGNRITFGAYSQGANDYQYRYRYNNESTAASGLTIPSRQRWTATTTIKTLTIPSRQRWTATTTIKTST